MLLRRDVFPTALVSYVCILAVVYSWSRVMRLHPDRLCASACRWGGWRWGGGGAQEMLKGLLKAAAVIDLVKMGSRTTRTQGLVTTSKHSDSWSGGIPKNRGHPPAAKGRPLRIGARLYGNCGIGKRKADAERSAAAVVICRPGILSELFHNPLAPLEAQLPWQGSMLLMVAVGWVCASVSPTRNRHTL